MGFLLAAAALSLDLLETCQDLAAWRQQQQGPLHFVPTMGALHDGHQQLIRRAAALRQGSGEPPSVLLSVFVNPLQFGPGEDLESYPRDLRSDIDLAAAAGATALFAPSVAEIYPRGEAGLTRVAPPLLLRQGLCGRHRPQHFEGVATVVIRLLTPGAP